MKHSISSMSTKPPKSRRAVSSNTDGNSSLDTSENIQVHLRVRPLNPVELKSGEMNAWSIGGTSISLKQIPRNAIVGSSNRASSPAAGLSQTASQCLGKHFNYNSCYGLNSSNEQVYERSVKSIVSSSLEGINGTVFMYGQTGSGKTHTMLGDFSSEIQDITMSQNSMISSASASNNLNIPRPPSSSSARRVKNLNLSNSKTPSRGSVTASTTPRLEQQPYSRHEPMTPGIPRTKSKTLVSKSSLSKSPLHNPSTNKLQQHKRTAAGIQKKLKTQTRHKSMLSGCNPGSPQTLLSPVKKHRGPFKSINLKGSSKKSNLSIYNDFEMSLASVQTPSTSSANVDYSSMLVPPGNGVLILALKDLFAKISERSNEKTFIVNCSYFEIYNDCVFDLLSCTDSMSDPLSVVQDMERKEFMVRGLSMQPIGSFQECLEILKHGEQNRHYAATLMNHNSSRSHTIFRVQLQGMTRDQDAPKEAVQDLSEATFQDQVGAASGQITDSVLNFVDLAGSQRLNSNPNQDKNGNKRMREGQFINKSLFFLTQVISLRSEGKRDHIPYRNSVLTKILRSSLGGNSRTVIVLCMTPTVAQIEQSLSTLRFGQSAKKIENKIHANVTCQGKDETLRLMISEYERRMVDMERAMTKDKTRSDTLLSMISDLQNQKQLLHDRLIRLNNSRLTRRNGRAGKPRKIPEDEQETLLHYPGVGTIYTCAASINFFPKKKLCRFLRGEEANELVKAEKASKITLQALRNVKLKNKLMNQKLELLSSHLSSLEADRHKLEQQIESQNQTILKQNQQAQTTSAAYQKEIASLKARIQLVQKHTPLGDQSEDDLTELEYIHDSGVSKIKEEKLKRQMTRTFEEFASALLQNHSTRPHTPNSCSTQEDPPQENYFSTSSSSDRLMSMKQVSTASLSSLINQYATKSVSDQFKENYEKSNLRGSFSLLNYNTTSTNCEFAKKVDYETLESSGKNPFKRVQKVQGNEIEANFKDIQQAQQEQDRMRKAQIEEINLHLKDIQTHINELQDPEEAVGILKIRDNFRDESEENTPESEHKYLSTVKAQKYDSISTAVMPDIHIGDFETNSEHNRTAELEEIIQNTSVSKEMYQGEGEGVMKINQMIGTPESDGKDPRGGIETAAFNTACKESIASPAQDKAPSNVSSFEESILLKQTDEYQSEQSSSSICSQQLKEIINQDDSNYVSVSSRCHDYPFHVKHDSVISNQMPDCSYRSNRSRATSEEVEALVRKYNTSLPENRRNFYEYTTNEQKSSQYKEGTFLSNQEPTFSISRNYESNDSRKSLSSSKCSSGVCTPVSLDPELKAEELYEGEHEDSLISSNVAMSDIGYDVPKRESGQIYQKIQALENLFSDKGKAGSSQSGRSSYGKQFLMKKTGNRLVKAMGALSARTPALRNARK